MHPAVLLALQRDLGIDETTARRRLSDGARAAAAEPGIARAAGPAYAGSWFDAATGKLVVAVTDAALAETVRARGARPEVVKRSHARLDAIKRHLDDLAGRRPGAAAGVAAWRVDPTTNRVVVTTLAGQPPGALVAAARAHGDAVRFETTTGVPGAAADYVDGGERISSGSSQCSIGFNARLTRNPAAAPRQLGVQVGHHHQGHLRDHPGPERVGVPGGPEPHRDRPDPAHRLPGEGRWYAEITYIQAYTGARILTS